MKWSLQWWTQFIQLRKETWKNSSRESSTGFEPVTSRDLYDALRPVSNAVPIICHVKQFGTAFETAQTNWVTKQGARQLWARTIGFNLHCQTHKPCPAFSAIFMPAFEVLFKVSCLSESLSTLLTRERFVTTVCTAVHGKAARTQERFTAQAAEILLLACPLLGTLFFVVNKPNNQDTSKRFRPLLTFKVSSNLSNVAVYG